MPIIGGKPFQIAGLLALYPNACIIVSAAFGADLNANPATWVWTDITADVRQADGGFVSITPMGRSDETSTAQPAGCTFELDNLSGKYTAYNPASSFYPNVRRNTPIKVEINLTGNSVDTDIRFQGNATGFKPTWDVAAALPVVTVTAQGVTRRLSQGKSAKLSSLRRSYDADAVQPVAYWPLEEPQGTTTAYDTITNAPSAVGGFTNLVSGNAGAPQFGAVDAGPGSAPIANLAGGWNLDLNLPPVAATGAVTYEFTAAFGTTVRNVGVQTCGIRLNPATAAKHLQWSIGIFDDGKVNLRWLEADSGLGLLAGPTEVYAAGSGVRNIFDGQPRNFALNLVASGGTNVAWTLYENDVILGSGTITPSFAGAMNAPPWRASGNSTNAADVLSGWGHVAVWNQTSTSDRAPAMTGHVGELATDRLTRLCAEQGVQLTITGTSTTTMGPQGVDAFLPLLRECETADQGVLYDGLGPGLGYVTRDARYNASPALTADMATRQVDDPFEPVDDDQRDRNLAKVDRKGGSSYTYEQTTGPKGTAAIGVYDTSLTVSVDSDAVLPDYASWITHLGTVEGFRYPRLNLDLAAVPALAAGWLATAISSRIDVTNVTSAAPQHPAGTVRLLLEGWSEQLSPFDWTAQGNMSQYEPWRVGVLANTTGDTNPLLGHLDTDNSTTSGTTAPAASTITVVTNSGPVWTQTADDFPFDVLIGGQRVSISAISPAANDPFSRTLTDTWGNEPVSGQAYTYNVSPVGLFAVVGGAQGRIITSAINTLYYGLLDAGATDHTVQVSIACPVLPTGSGISLRVPGRWTDANNYYEAMVLIDTAGAATLSISRRVLGTGATVASGVAVGTHAAGNQWTIVFDIDGTALSARAWNASTGSDPGVWQRTGTDPNLTSGTLAGAGVRRETGNTNGTVNIDVDNLLVSNPQRFTVAPAGSQVLYAIPAGTAVNVADPVVLAL